MNMLRRGVTIEGLFILVATFVGFVWTMEAIGDNTMFVHLRTGIDIVSSGHFPRSDPYSYTAPGHPWVLQSWLSEVVYGVLHAVGTSRLVVIVNALIFAIISGVMVYMARTGDALRTLIAASAVMLMSVGQWSIRPTTFAFFLFLILVAKPSLKWTAIVGALWVNAHGSWPVGIGWLAATTIGARIEGPARQELKRLGAFVAGVVVFGVVNPIGWRLLAFPFTAMQKSKVFSVIKEWQSPDFHSLTSTAGGVLLAGIMIALVAMARRPIKWQQSLPVMLVLALTLYSQRNAPFLAIAFAPVLGAALRVDKTSLTRRWGPVEVFAIVALGFVALFQIIRLQVGGPYAFGEYPVTTIKYAETLGYFNGDRHVLMPEYAGCYRILDKGDNARVFIDDRYDMYPAVFSQDAISIAHLGENMQALLDQYRVQAVIWPSKDPLSTFLRANPRWKEVTSDRSWSFFEHT